MMKRRTILAAGAAMLATPALHAQPGFPSRQLRMIVPFAAGGPTDLQMRALCDIASRQLGQQVVVENRSGSASILGAMALAADRVADGHLLSQMPSNTFSYPLTTKNAPFDPLRDFTWIMQVTGYTYGLVVKADSPHRSMADLLAHARRHPGEVTYGTTAVGGVPHLLMERLSDSAGVTMTNIPFRGGHETVTSILSGAVIAMAGSGWTEFVRQGQMRALCVWGAQRLAAFPEVPTLRECGFDMVETGPYGFAGPKGLPAPVVAKLHDAFRQAMQDPAHLAVLRSLDMELNYLGPEDYAASVTRMVAQNRATLGRLGLLAK